MVIKKIGTTSITGVVLPVFECNGYYFTQQKEHNDENCSTLKDKVPCSMMDISESLENPQDNAVFLCDIMCNCVREGYSCIASKESLSPVDKVFIKFFDKPVEVYIDDK